MNGTANNYLAGRLGIGTAAPTSTNVVVSLNITGAVASNGVYQLGIVQSDVTTSAYGFRNLLNTAAATFTLTTYNHYAAQGGGTALTCYGGIYSVGYLSIGSGYGIIPSTAYEVLNVQGPNTSTIANQWYATYRANILPYVDTTWDLGKAGSGRWRDIFTDGAVTTTSDRTKKENIRTSALGLDFINKLNPVSYTMITGSKVWEELPPTISVLEEEAVYDGEYLIREATYKEIPNPEEPKIIEIIPGKRTHYGLIAQDVKEVLDEMGIGTIDFAGYMAADPTEHVGLALRYDEFLSPMIKAIQELSSKIDLCYSDIHL
jgi:hypothetical protein